MRLGEVFILLVLLAPRVCAQAVPHFEPADCLTDTQNGECGFLVVPLQHFNAEENREIRVALVRYKGDNSDTALVFLNGGPGAPILDPTARTTLWSDLARDIG